jgi:hypothetical protein
MDAEGWYHDPYGRHEARWFSDGTPTDLVRDGREVAHDEPPPDPPQGPLVPWAGDTNQDHGDDLRRADSGQESDPAPYGKEYGTKMARAILNPNGTEYW